MKSLHDAVTQGDLGIEDEWYLRDASSNTYPPCTTPMVTTVHGVFRVGWDEARVCARVPLEASEQFRSAFKEFCAREWAEYTLVHAPRGPSGSLLSSSTGGSVAGARPDTGATAASAVKITDVD